VAFRKHHKVEHVPFVAVTSPIDLCREQKPSDLTRICGLIADVGGKMRTDYNVEPVLVVIDTVNRAMKGADENAPTDMGKFVAAMDTIRSRCNCHVLAIHHTGKTPAKARAATPRWNARLTP
jgi:hypothetical protein